MSPISHTSHHPPEHISGPLDRVTRALVDPRIADAIDREDQGEIIDWPVFYEQMDAEDRRNADNPAQLSLGMYS